MAFWKRRSMTFSPNPPDTKHEVHYIGKEPAEGKIGLECTMKPVANMYRRYKQTKGKHSQRMLLEVTNTGIILTHLNGADGQQEEQIVPVVKMSFGAADPEHPKIFSFVMVNDQANGPNKWECHAFLCENPSVAKSLTLYLVKAFQKAADGRDDKDEHFIDPNKRTRPTTLHILHDRGRLEHQIADKSKPPPVSTLKVTMNIENIEDYDKVGIRKQEKTQGSPVKLDQNKHFAMLLAKEKKELEALKMVNQAKITDLDGNTLSDHNSAVNKENEYCDEDAVDALLEEVANEEGENEKIIIAVNPTLPLTPSSETSPGMEMSDDPHCVNGSNSDGDGQAITDIKSGESTDNSRKSKRKSVRFTDEEPKIIEG